MAKESSTLIHPDTTKPLSFNPEIPAQNININFTQDFTQKLNIRNEPEDMRWKSNTMNT